METADNILREMRDWAKYPNYDIEQFRDMLDLADRIEVAVKALVADRDNWRRQALAEDAMANAATCENSSQVGNAAKMRKALEGLIANIEMRSSTFGLNVVVDTKTFLDAKAALSAPAGHNPSKGIPK